MKPLWEDFLGAIELEPEYGSQVILFFFTFLSLGILIKRILLKKLSVNQEAVNPRGSSTKELF